VSNEYDGFADPIRNPSNLLTVANAVMGIAVVHPFAQNSDLATVPARNITTTVNGQGGTTVTYRVPAQQLPLTKPLRDLGVPGKVVDGIDATLRPIIDSGYQPCPRPRADVRNPGPAAAGRRAARATGSVRTGDFSSPRAAAGTSGRRSPVR